MKLPKINDWIRVNTDVFESNSCTKILKGKKYKVIDKFNSNCVSILDENNKRIGVHYEYFDKVNTNIKLYKHILL